MMKRPLQPLFRTLASLSLLLCISGARAQVTLDKQLLVNPGAEDGPSAPKGFPVASIPGWNTFGTPFTVLDYTPTSELPDSQGLRIGGGSHYFFGGSNISFSYARQFIDVTPVAPTIDGGNVYAVLSAFMAALNQEDDNGVIECKFYNGSDTIIGPTLSLGPQPGNTSQLIYWRTQGLVPPGTRKIEVQMIGFRQLGKDDDVYFDNLGLFLTQSLPYPNRTITPQTRKTESGNLLVNPDAESGSAAPNGTDKVAIPGWQTTGPFTVVAYGGPHAPAANQFGFTIWGQKAFSGGQADAADTPSTAYQDVDLTPYAADIDAGKYNLQFALWLTGAGADDGVAGGEVGIPHATVDEIDASGAVVMTMSTDRIFGQNDSLTSRSREAPLLKGVRKARVTLYAERGRLSSYDAAFFDNLNLILVDAFKLPDLTGYVPNGIPVDYGVNLLADPGAEGADPRFDDYLSNVVQIPGWDQTGNFTAVDYYQSDFVIGPEGERIGGGRNFFSGGNNADLSTASQTIDVSPHSIDIDEGRAKVHLEAQMGGWGGQGDFGMVVAGFFDYSSALIDTLVMGPSSSRNTFGGSLDFFEKDGDVPPGTRQIRFMLTGERIGGGFNDAYFDNLWMSLEHKASPDVLLGDVNGDGNVAVDDAVMLLRYCLHLDTLDALGIARADMNKDGTASIADAPLVLRRLVGLPWQG